MGAIPLHEWTKPDISRRAGCRGCLAKGKEKKWADARGEVFEAF